MLGDGGAEHKGELERAVMISHSFPRRFGEIQFNQVHIQARFASGAPGWTCLGRACGGAGYLAASIIEHVRMVQGRADVDNSRQGAAWQVMRKDCQSKAKIAPSASVVLGKAGFWQSSPCSEPKPLPPLIMMEIKIQCSCGTRYKFDTEPVQERLPGPVFCPICNAEGTLVANRIIQEKLEEERLSKSVQLHVVAEPIEEEVAPVATTPRRVLTASTPKQSWWKHLFGMQVAGRRS
jgi:hypothetical protein